MSLSTTALHGLHEELGGRLVDFAGWELPVQFAGIIAEHQHTRKSASLFDVSHMGQVLIYPESGNLADAAAALETLIPASVAGLKEGRQRYGLFTDENGGVLDDLMFANHGDHYFQVVNAARSDHDLGLLRTLERVTVEHITDRSLLALQGPRAEEALAGLIPDAAGLRFMDSRILDWDGVTVWVSRSGYTGEDGFEISVPSAEAERLARALLGIGWVLPAGPSRKRVGLRAEGRAPVREGAKLFLSETATEPVAEVTSGGFGPTVGGPIAMAMLPTDIQPGATVHAEVRGRRLPLTVTALPFITPSYKR